MIMPGGIGLILLLLLGCAGTIILLRVLQARPFLGALLAIALVPVFTALTHAFLNETDRRADRPSGSVKSVVAVVPPLPPPAHAPGPPGSIQIGTQHLRLPPTPEIEEVLPDLSLPVRDVGERMTVIGRGIAPEDACESKDEAIDDAAENLLSRLGDYAKASRGELAEAARRLARENEEVRYELARSLVEHGIALERFVEARSENDERVPLGIVRTEIAHGAIVEAIKARLGVEAAAGLQRRAGEARNGLRADIRYVLVGIGVFVAGYVILRHSVRVRFGEKGPH